MKQTSLHHPPFPFNTLLAWRFEGVEDAPIQIKKGALSIADFPVLTPLPSKQFQTKPLENEVWTGPYLYFLLDGQRRLCLVGRTQASGLLKHWISTGYGGKATHYWAHQVERHGCTRKIAEAMRNGDGPFELRYASLVRIKTEMGIAGNLKQVMSNLTATLSPTWEN